MKFTLLPVIKESGRGKKKRRQGSRNRLKGAGGRGTLEKEKLLQTFLPFAAALSKYKPCKFSEIKLPFSYIV
jgi:hypothetical protein